MRFYTRHECEEWLSVRQRTKPHRSITPHHAMLPYPSEPFSIFSLAHGIASTLTYRQPTLLWISEWGIWPSSENWHLYYRLRQSYDDQRLLAEAPGHLFLEHEVEDLASFLQVAILSGWDGYVLTQADYVNAFLSHDEYIEFHANVKENLKGICEVFSETPMSNANPAVKKPGI